MLRYSILFLNMVFANTAVALTEEERKEVDSRGRIPGKENCTWENNFHIRSLENCGIINGDLSIDGEYTHLDNGESKTYVKEIYGCLQIRQTQLKTLDFLSEKTKLRRKCAKRTNDDSIISGNFYNLTIPKNVYISIRRQIGSQPIIEAQNEEGTTYGGPGERFYGILCNASEALLPRENTSDCEELQGKIVFENLVDEKVFEQLSSVQTIAGQVVIKNTTLTKIDFFRALKHFACHGKGPAFVIKDNSRLKTFRMNRFHANCTGRTAVVVNNGDFRMSHKDLSHLEGYFGKKKILVPTEEDSLYSIDQEESPLQNDIFIYVICVGAPLSSFVLSGMIVIMILIYFKPKLG